MTKIPYPQKYTYHEIEKFTDTFSKENFIGNTQYGKLYRAKLIDQSRTIKDVTIKVWCLSKLYDLPSDVVVNPYQLFDEVMVLGNKSSISDNPNMVKLIGYCQEKREEDDDDDDDEQLALVYDLKAMATLHQLIPKDNFEWVDRMKVGFGLACQLEIFNCRKHLLIRNLDAAHIVLDQNYIPKLVDFGISSGIRDYKIKYSQRRHEHGCYGYIDPNYATTGKWNEKCDVFAFGVILLQLISKRVFQTGEENISEEPFDYEWAQNYKSNKFVLRFYQGKNSLVHKSLRKMTEYSHSDGHKVTKLAMKCVRYHPSERPTMRDVVESLLKLRVAKQHAYSVGSPPIYLWS